MDEEVIVVKAQDLIGVDDYKTLLLISGRVAETAKQLYPSLDPEHAVFIALDFMAKYYENSRDVHAGEHNLFVGEDTENATRH